MPFEPWHHHGHGHDHDHGGSHSHGHLNINVLSTEDAARYIEAWGEHPTNRMTATMAELEARDVVVDIGCGSGAALRASTGWVLKGRLIGVDPTPEMIRQAKEKVSGLKDEAQFTFLEAPAEALPVEDGIATVVWAINTVDHWSDPAAGLAEAHRVLAGGGRVLIAAEDVDGRMGHGDGAISDPEHVRELLGDAGFRGAEVSRHFEGDVKMILVRARRPWR